mgnify:CR=1 FL=1
MENNDIIRRIRYIFDFNDSKMIELFGQGELEVTRTQISSWLKKEEDLGFNSIFDHELAAFLNGFIIEKRGKREGPPMVAEKSLTNNIVFRKLKIALNLKDEDILQLFQEVDLRVGKHELSALFRKPTQSQYRVCKDQFLRNFLQAIQKKYRKN